MSYPAAPASLKQCAEQTRELADELEGHEDTTYDVPEMVDGLRALGEALDEGALLYNRARSALNKVKP